MLPPSAQGKQVACSTGFLYLSLFRFPLWSPGNQEACSMGLETLKQQMLHTVLPPLLLSVVCSSLNSHTCLPQILDGGQLPLNTNDGLTEASLFA